MSGAGTAGAAAGQTGPAEGAERRSAEPLARFDEDRWRRYLAGLSGAAAFPLGRDFVKVEGPDSLSYLQGQLSQDLAPLGAGGSAWSLLLSPKGKLVATLRVTRLGDQSFLLDGDEGTGAPVVERLARFKLRSRLDIAELPWRAVALRGERLPGASSLSAAPGHLLLPAAWGPVPGADLVGEAPELPDGAERWDADLSESLRIETGTARFGAELSEDVIPAEAGLVERYVSFTKGCYTGQELVARIDSRGSNVPRRLRGLVFPSGPGTAARHGAELFVDGRSAGTLTSVGWCPRLGGFGGMGLLRRAAQPGAEIRIGDPEGPPAEVRELPLVP